MLRESEIGGLPSASGRGLPGKPAGDQYVQLKVVLPPATSAEAKAVYDEMRAKLNFNPRADLTG